MQTTDVHNKYVGLDLTAGDVTEAVVAAIQKDNPNVKVSRYPAWVKVESYEKLLILRESVEEFLGMPWNPRDLELIVTSYYGFMTEWDDDKILLQWDNV